jgi:hypothetical protein
MPVGHIPSLPTRISGYRPLTYTAPSFSAKTSGDKKRKTTVDPPGFNKYTDLIPKHPVPVIRLESLGNGIPVIPDDAVAFYKNNCMVCFHLTGHASGVRLAVHYNGLIRQADICWTGQISQQLLMAHGDLKKATDFAACTIALMLVRELTEYTAIEQSAEGTTIDYYLTEQQPDNDLIFNRAARLEVSGILSETPNNTVDGRIRRKTRRLKPESDLTDFIVVVEFSKPWSKMVEA